MLGKSNDWHYDLETGQENSILSSAVTCQQQLSLSCLERWKGESSIQPSATSAVEVAPFLLPPLLQHENHASALFLMKAVMVAQITQY